MSESSPRVDGVATAAATRTVSLAHAARVIAAVLGACLALGATPARAYGPMTHMAEAQAALERMRDEGPPALADLPGLVDGDPVARMHLLVGAILPDFRETSASILFPSHDRGFAEHLISTVAANSSRSAADRALALGLASHVCSDVAAQVFAVPRFMALGRVGAPDVMPGYMDDRPDGEAELLVEGILDIYYGDASDLLELYDHFQPDPPDPARLDAALDVWLEEAALYFGAQATGDPTSIREEIHGTLGRVAAQLTEERRGQLLGALDLAQEFNLGDVLILVDGVGLLDDLVSQGYEVELDYGEIYRLQAASPFFGDNRFFAPYPDDLAALGPAILLGAAHGDPWLTTWPTWRAEPLAAATAQSLAGVPGSPLREGEPSGPPLPSHGDLGLYDLWWEDPSTGLRVDAVSTASTSATALVEVELVAQVYPLVVGAAPGPFRLQVRKAVPEAPYLSGPVLAERTVEPELGAAALAGTPAWELRLLVPLGDEALVQADGLHAELVPAPAGPETAPGFTTAFEPWFPLALPAWGLDGPVYEGQMSTYEDFPRSLRVEPRVVDLSPPSAPSLETSPDRLSAGSPTLRVDLEAEDAGSGLLGYVLSLGTEEGAADLVDATSIPALGPQRRGLFEWTAPPERIATGGAVFVTAHAVNGAGLSGPEASAGPVPLDPGERHARSGGCGCDQGGPGGPGGPHAGLLSDFHLLLLLFVLPLLLVLLGLQRGERVRPSHLARRGK